MSVNWYKSGECRIKCERIGNSLCVKGASGITNLDFVGLAGWKTMSVSLLYERVCLQSQLCGRVCLHHSCVEEYVYNHSCVEEWFTPQLCGRVCLQSQLCGRVVHTTAVWKSMFTITVV